MENPPLVLKKMDGLTDEIIACCDEAIEYQRDADVEWFDKWVGQVLAAMTNPHTNLGSKVLADAEAAFRKARQETARGIFEELYSKCSIEAQRLDSKCDWDRLVVRRCDLQALKEKYVK